MKVDAAGTGQGKLRRAIHIADATGMLGVAILLRAARDSRISLFVCQPESAHDFKNWATKTIGQPGIALIGDDDGLRRGAPAWGGYAYRMARWASRVMAHAAGAEAAHYEGAILTAEGGARVLVIETCVASAPSWLRVLAAIPPRPTLVIWPRDGAHPLPEDRGRAH